MRVQVHGFVLSAFATTTARRSSSSCIRAATAAAQSSNSRWLSLAKASSQQHQRILLGLSSSFSTTSATAAEDYYTVGVTGASGLVGKALLNELSQRDTLLGKPLRVVKLIRGDKADDDAQDKLVQDTSEITSVIWNPNGSSAEDIIPSKIASQINAIVHLSGENVSTGLGPLGFLGIRPWTAKKKAEIINSRVITTKALSKVVAAAAANEPKTFLVASGVGVYGDKFIGDALAAADETQDVEGVEGFLAHVSRVWEDATMEAKTTTASSDTRVVNMRLGVVMSKKGGALEKLYPVFFLGGGGRIGAGNQYFTFISARDLARAIIHCLETPSLEGPINMCAPNPATNMEFTKALGAVMSRPTFLPFPGFAVSLLFGQMGEEMLLGGVRAVPKKLLDSGFEFQHPTIKEALESAMTEDI